MWSLSLRKPANPIDGTAATKYSDIQEIHALDRKSQKERERTCWWLSTKIILGAQCREARLSVVSPCVEFNALAEREE